MYSTINLVKSSCPRKLEGLRRNLLLCFAKGLLSNGLPNIYPYTPVIVWLSTLARELLSVLVTS